MNKEKLNASELAKYYRTHLIEEVMPFWEKRAADPEGGGYYTFFDRAGNVVDTRKYTWVQARQTYMFSTLYRHIEKRPEWLELATRGRDFLVQHAYAGDGRWHYQLDRYGSVEQANLSMASDAFALMGLCEYATASGSDADRALIEKTFAVYEQNTNDPDNVEFYHFVFDPKLEYHSPYMLAVNVCSVVRDILGKDRVRPLLDASLQKVLYTFAKDDYSILFETLAKDGSVLDTQKGRTVNPGHALESMWFCMEEGIRREDRTIIDRCIEISRWNLEKAWDEKHGGLFAFVDPDGKQVEVSHSIEGIGEIWDAKIWWVHSEALYTLALCSLYAEDDLFPKRFLELHRFTRDNFYDPEYGGWYMYLHRDGSRYDDRKGNGYKSAFHVPRALMKLALLFG